MKQFTVAIAGLGPRGFYTYAQYQKIHPETMKVVAVADIDKGKLAAAKEDLGLPGESCFNSAEELLAKDRLADVLIVATQDAQHIAHAVAGIRKGYHIILEKPIATTLEDCYAIRNEAAKYKRAVAVCHVLRYTAFYRTVKDIILSGRIGEVVDIDALENVGYWHQAHSFVRGNWNNSYTSSPMILAKCCHDLDILNFLIGGDCERLSSFGSLKHFNAESKPAGAADRCIACKYQDTCPYSATEIYLAPDAREKREWFCYVAAPDGTRESLERAIAEGPYGRCVYACDNNVVDHQVVAMRYSGGVTATLTMSAFSAEVYRSVRVMGTLGEIEGNQLTNIIKVTPFGGEPEYYDINKIATDLSGHGGGDNQMMTDFFDMLENGGGVATSVDNSLKSHTMAFAAEYSRMHDGESVKISEVEKSFIAACK